MSREKIILYFEKDNKKLKHIWVIKKGIRGARDSNKVRKLQAKWGDPVQIIGSGPVATLLRKEYKEYYKDKEKYEGISTKEMLTVGAEITGVPVKKLQEVSKKLGRFLKRE